MKQALKKIQILVVQRISNETKKNWHLLIIVIIVIIIIIIIIIIPVIIKFI